MLSMSKVHKERFSACYLPFLGLIVALMLNGGCCRTWVGGIGHSAHVQCSLRLTEISKVGLYSELAAIGTNDENMLLMLSRLGATDEEIREIVTDPFHSKTFQRVHILFTCKPSDVASYCLKRLQHNGWTHVRGILLSEYTNSGGDWVKVFGKGHALARVHIFGYSLDMNEVSSSDNRVERKVTFDLIDIPASQFLSEIGVKNGD